MTCLFFVVWCLRLWSQQRTHRQWGINLKSTPFISCSSRCCSGSNIDLFLIEVNPSSMHTEWAISSWVAGCTVGGAGAAGGHRLPLLFSSQPLTSFLPSPHFPPLRALPLYSAQPALLGACEQVLFPCQGPLLEEMAGIKLAWKWLGNQVNILNSHTHTHTNKAAQPPRVSKNNDVTDGGWTGK